MTILRPLIPQGQQLPLHYVVIVVLVYHGARWKLKAEFDSSIVVPIGVCDADRVEQMGGGHQCDKDMEVVECYS